MQSIRPKYFFKPCSSLIYVTQQQPDQAFLEPRVYLLVFESQLVIIGIPPIESLEGFFLEIRKAFPTQTIKYLILQGYTSHLYTIMKYLHPFAPDSTIITDQLHTKYMNLPKHSQPLRSIQSLEYHLTISETSTLSFIPSPYLLSAGSFMTYESSEQVLFSGYLFANPNGLKEVSELDYLTPSLKYLTDYLPSSDFTRSILNHLDQYPIERVLTLFHNDLSKSQLDFLRDRFMKFDFYRVSNIEQTKQGQIFDPSPFFQQLVRKLSTVYGTKAVSEAFQGSPFVFHPISESLELTTLDGIRAWHRFFDIVYANGGLEWLGILEPTIDKLVEMYHLTKPTIFSSAIVDTTKQLEQVVSEKAELTSRMKQLEEDMQATVDRLVKDPLTGLYNASFLEANLIERFEQIQLGKQDHFTVCYLAIDHMHRINRMYSYQIGDETIVHFTTLIHSLLQPNDRLYRASGVSLALVTNRPVLDSELEKIQASVRESTYFIQPITASIAIVRSDEIPTDSQAQMRAKTLLTTAENRIQMAFQKGGNVLINQESIITKPRRGKVLIVDEDLIDAKYFRNALENEAFDVDWVADGLEALRRMESTQYHAILCDKYVPKLDGFALKAQINKTVNQDLCFILIVQAKTAEIVARANRLGMTAVLSRPILIEEIVGFIQRNQGKRG